MRNVANRCQFWTALSLLINVIAVTIILAFLFDPNLIYLMLELKTRLPAIVPRSVIIVTVTPEPTATLTPTPTVQP